MSETFEQSLERLANSANFHEGLRFWKLAHELGWKAVSPKGQPDPTPQAYGGDISFDRGNQLTWYTSKGWMVAIVLDDRVCGQHPYGTLEEALRFRYSDEDIACYNELRQQHKELTRLYNMTNWADPEERKKGTEYSRELSRIGALKSSWPVVK